MDASYVTALAALFGSVVGSATSLATTIFTQAAQRKIDRGARDATKRELLYGQSLDEAARLYVEAMRSESDDPAMVVTISSQYSRMRLFSTQAVLDAAESVISSIIQINVAPNRTLREINASLAKEMLKPLHEFGDACREELDRIN